MDVLNSCVEFINLMAAACIEAITKYTQAQTSNRWRKFRISSVR